MRIEDLEEMTAIKFIELMKERNRIEQERNDLIREQNQHLETIGKNLFNLRIEE